MTLAGKTAVVTGGGRALGKCIALRLAREDAAVCILGPVEEEMQATEEDLRAIGASVVAVVADVRDESQIRAAFEQTRRRLGPVEILVNNAGIAGPTATTDQIELSDWDEVLAVNLTGAFLCVKYAAPQMIGQGGGCIINISSLAGKIAYPLRSPYAASKWGLIGLTMTLAKELASHHITVNAVCPGPVEGERMQRVIACRARELGQTEEQVRGEYLKAAAMGKMVSQNDVAAMVAFLASEQAASITGQAIDVAAGYAL